MSGVKKLRFILLFAVMSVCCFGCSNKEAAAGEVKADAENTVAASENLTNYFNSITNDNLDACNTYPDLDAYWADSLVLLNQLNDAVRLYGITEGEESAMLLYVRGEKVLINQTYKNYYQELPKLSDADIDNDGVAEIIISIRTGTDSSGNWYKLLVCDYDTAWNSYEYKDYPQDIDALIDYRYDEASRKIIFSDKEGIILAEIELPNWTEQYPYAGMVDFEGNIRFDAETMQMEVIPQIMVENSFPYSPIKIVFSVKYENGRFELEYDDLLYFIYTH
ncbi:MAG: hypothetical protein NC428_08635 [Clostridium sp.]|nr:hypothetical protein [Clostridium sp.]